MLLTAKQVAQYAKQAGFTGSALVTAVAIAQAESSFSTSALGDTTLEDSTWGPSVGLWQIRSLWSEAHTGGTRDQYANTAPLHNAQSAFIISNHGTGFSAWTTYINGAYLQYMSGARTAVASLQTVASSGGGSTTGGGSTSGGSTTGKKATSSSLFTNVGLDVLLLLAAGTIGVSLYKLYGKFYADS